MTQNIIEGWQGWCWGVDFSDGDRVIAVHAGGGGADIKYGYRWMGPITLTPETIPLLEFWAKRTLDVCGGYIHLLPADGDSHDELKEFYEEYKDLYEDDDAGSNRSRVVQGSAAHGPQPEDAD